MAQIQIRDVDGRPVPRVSIRISEGQKNSDAAIFDIVTDLAGNQGWPIPFWPKGDYTLHINKQDVLPAFKSTEVFIPKAQYDQDVAITLERNVAPRPMADLRAVHVDGPLLRLPDGTPWRWKLVTAFDAPRLFMNGELDKLKAYAQWTRDVGGNGWRMFGGWSRTHFDYRQVLDYFGKLEALCEFIGDEGLRGEYVCVTDGIPGDENEQRAFLDRCADVVSKFSWMFLQLANEPWKNGLEPLRFNLSRPDVLISRGAADGDPYYPSLGYTTIHPPRTEDWARKPGKDSYETRALTHDVVIPDEPMGFAERKRSGSRDNDPRNAFVAGVGAGLFCPGITAHGDSDTMQLCNVPGPTETACVREMFRGLELVPVDAPTWRYARYGPSNPGVPMPVQDDTGSGRLTDHLHAMIGDRQAVACNYYPSAGWVAVGANGWRVVNQDGSFVLCER